MPMMMMMQGADDVVYCEALCKNAPDNKKKQIPNFFVFPKMPKVNARSLGEQKKKILCFGWKHRS